MAIGLGKIFFTATVSLASVTCTFAAVIPAANAITVLDFEGLQDLEAVQDFYNGGTGGAGSSSGTNFGVSFSGNALAIIDADAGGSGNFGSEPSPDTVLFFLDGPAAVLNIDAGFDTGFSFFYSAINNPGFVNVYDDINSGGNLLATINLPLTPFNGAPDPTGQFSPFVAAGVSFSGVAKSIDFGGVVNQIGFDNITFGSATPGGGNGGTGEVPTPAMLPGLIGMGIAAWRKKKNQANEEQASSALA